MTCPVHGPGCFGLPWECEWIEQDIQQRRWHDDAYYRELEVVHDREVEAAFEAERFEMTGMGLA